MFFTTTYVTCQCTACKCQAGKACPTEQEAAAELCKMGWFMGVVWHICPNCRKTLDALGVDYAGGKRRVP